MPRIIRTPAAVRDLTAITDYIAGDNLTAALGFYDDVDRLLTMIAQYPDIGEAVEHLARACDVLRWATTYCSTAMSTTRSN